MLPGIPEHGHGYPTPQQQPHDTLTDFSRVLHVYAVFLSHTIPCAYPDAQPV